MWKNGHNECNGEDGKKRVNVWIPNGNVVLMEILVNFVIHGLLVVP